MVSICRAPSKKMMTTMTMTMMMIITPKDSSKHSRDTNYGLFLSFSITNKGSVNSHI